MENNKDNLQHLHQQRGPNISWEGMVYFVNSVLKPSKHVSTVVCVSQRLCTDCREDNGRVHLRQYIGEILKKYPSPLFDHTIMHQRECKIQ